jgi:hypothetical protein
VVAVLLPLLKLAKRLNVAIVNVIHCNKADVKALYKGTGSIQFAGKARSVFLVSENPFDPGEKVVCHIKVNNAQEVPSQSFVIEGKGGDPDKPILVWRPDQEGRWNKQTIMTGDSMGGKPSKLASCIEFTRGMLIHGPIPVSQWEAECDKAGYPETTRKRARFALELISLPPGKPGPGSEYYIALPGYERCTPLKTDEKNHHVVVQLLHEAINVLESNGNLSKSDEPPFFNERPL